MKDNTAMKDMMKDAAILFAITLVAGLLLGLVYQITKEPIANQKIAAKNRAYKEVFANADSFEEADADTEKVTAWMKENGYPGQSLGDPIMAAYDAAGARLGYILTMITSEGYGGDIIFTMGIQNDGTLNGISLLSIAETPGLGMKAEDILAPQFANKNVSAFEYTKSGAVSDKQIDAITGATKTTNAITNGVNAGLAYFQEKLEKGGNGNE